MRHLFVGKVAGARRKCYKFKNQRFIVSSLITKLNSQLNTLSQASATTTSQPLLSTHSNSHEEKRTFYISTDTIALKQSRVKYSEATRSFLFRRPLLVENHSKVPITADEYDITVDLPPDKLQAYTRRMMLRTNRILACAARIQLPRDAIPEELLRSDQIQFHEIQGILNAIRNDSEDNEPDTSQQGDFSQVPLPPDYAQIKEEIHKRVAEAQASCHFTASEEAQLRDTLSKFEELFRIDIGKGDAPAKIPPYNIRLKHGAVPKRVRARGHSPKALAILQETLDRLEEQGLIYKNYDSRWSAPVMIVPKPGKKDQWRLVIDLRYINLCSEPVSWSMPALDYVIAQTRGAKYFSTWDFCSGYWQCDVAADSQEYFSFNTPFGCYTPRRLPQGHHASPMYFHSHVQKIFDSLIKKGKCLIWIDDVLIWGNTWEEYHANLVEFLKLCKQHSLKLSIKKSTVATPKAQWCGREIDGEGVKYMPRNYETMDKLAVPTTAGELCQFVSALTWMTNGLQRLAEVKAPLQELLQHIYELAGSTKKNKFEKIYLPALWTEAHQEAFNQCKSLLTNTLKQSHLIPGATICMLTDASDRFYAALLTQVEHWEEGLPVEQQRHLPLSTMSGKFNESQIKWSTIEKEAFPIIEACNLWEYYLLNGGFRLYTDHANIKHLFSPELIDPPLKRASMDKVHRWLLTLSHFHLISLEHLPGERNVWADLLSRWGQEDYHIDTDSVVHAHIKHNRALTKRKKNPKYSKIITEMSRPDFQYPTMDVIEVSQAFHKEAEIDALSTLEGNLLPNVTEERGIIFVDELIWIPSSDIELQCRILTVAHCGESGHTGISNTLAKVEKHFYWQSMKEDVANFCHNCLVCDKVRDGEVVPVPWGNTLTVTRPNELLVFDYLYIEKPKTAGVHNYKYVLVLKDEFSGQVELIPTEACNHQAVAEAIAWWISRYGKPDMLRSDQGSHFKNNVINELSSTWNITHNFTLPYTPWSNGSVEIVNKTIKRVLRTIILENGLATDDWPFLLPTLQGYINGTPSERLAKHAPREVFMGLKANDPFHVLYHPHSDTISKVSLTSSSDIKEIMVLFRKDLEALHKKVSLARKARRIAADKAFRKKHDLPEEDDTGILIPDCDYRIGDYVLVAVANTKPLSKLDAIWRGPYRVAELVHTELNARGDYNNRTFIVEHLVSKERITTHAMRMKFYSDKHLDEVTDMELLEQHILAQEKQMFEIVRVVQHKFDNFTMQWIVRVVWKDSNTADPETDDEDSMSWEPLANILTDQPALIRAYWETLPSGSQRSIHFKTLLRDFDVYY